MDEQQAIARLKQGDLNALETLVNVYQALAVHTAFLIVAERALAEDIVQAAFLKAAKKIGQFDASRPFRPWFLRMVVNDSLKAARRQQRTPSLDAPSEAVLAWLTDPAPGPHELVETDELKRVVWDALRQLSPEQRAVIVQRHFLEMDEAEMVQELQRPPSTVKWWLHTARERLKILLRPETGRERMKNIELQAILAGIAEEAAPSLEINLWPGLRRGLATSESRFSKGDASMKIDFLRTPTLRRAALAMVAMVVVLALLLTTPQGRAWAQSVLQFFSRAESDRLPLQPFQLTPVPTLSPESVAPDSFPLSVDEAQTLAGYKVFIPSQIKGHNFYGAEYDPVMGTVSINFSDPEIGLGNGFLITEQLLASSQEPYPLQGVVGASAPVETVQIGNLSGEYVMGVWKLTDSGPVWEAEPFLQTLRWKSDKMFFEIVYMGNKLAKDDLILIAESLH